MLVWAPGAEERVRLMKSCSETGMGTCQALPAACHHGGGGGQ